MELAGYEETLHEDTDEVILFTRNYVRLIIASIWDPLQNFQAYLEATDAFKEAIDIFNSAEFQKKAGWKKEAEDEELGVVVHSRRINRKKIFSMRVSICFL